MKCPKSHSMGLHYINHGFCLQRRGDIVTRVKSNIINLEEGADGRRIRGGDVGLRVEALKTKGDGREN